MHALAAVCSGFLLAVFAPALHRRTGRAAGWILALLPLGLVAYFASLAPAVWRGEVLLAVHEWAPSLGVSLAFRLDGLSLLFALLITGMGAVVIIYGGGYLSGHAELGRFYALMLFFMASMLGVVVADNLILIFIFWELTSVSSYLLIGFDHEREKARKAALQALLVTTVGGLALLAGLVLMGQAAGSFELGQLFLQADLIRSHELYGFMLVLVLLGAFTKSAQFPFHFWLPAAMEAPTPVSAYLHAATMVKAGVYLLARLTPVMGGTESWFYAVTLTGAATMFVGAFLGLYKTDLKQILAYTTVSVLGVLVFLIGLGTTLAFQAMGVYLIAHGLYKGALFLVAGAVDHEAGTREIGQLGGLRRAMPITAVVGLLAALSMAGLPPLFGFVGKEMLYEAGIHAPAWGTGFTVVAVATGILLFALAGVAGIRPFFGAAPATPPPKHAHEAPVSMWLGPSVLAVGGLALGLAPAWMAGAVHSTVAAMAPDREVQVALSLFHGLNPALMLSALTVAGGLGLYGLHGRLVQSGSWLAPLENIGPARGYDQAVNGMLRLAYFQTRVLQSGYLRYYLLTMILCTVGFAGFALLRQDLAPRLVGLTDLRFHEIMLAMVILVSTLVAVRSSSRLAAVAALGVVGLGVALVFAFFGAPDLAMTQLVVETLTVILLVLILYHLPDFTTFSKTTGRLRDTIIALGAGGLMSVLVLAASTMKEATSISSFYVENSYRLAQGRNMVNVILTDFRVLDTLGEIIVLGVAGVGVYSLLRLRIHEKGDKK